MFSPGDPTGPLQLSVHSPDAWSLKTGIGEKPRTHPDDLQAAQRLEPADTTVAKQLKQLRSRQRKAHESWLKGKIYMTTRMRSSMTYPL